MHARPDEEIAEADDPLDAVLVVLPRHEVDALLRGGRQALENGAAGVRIAVDASRPAEGVGHEEDVRVRFPGEAAEEPEDVFPVVELEAEHVRPRVSPVVHEAVDVEPDEGAVGPEVDRRRRVDRLGEGGFEGEGHVGAEEDPLAGGLPAEDLLDEGDALLVPGDDGGGPREDEAGQEPRPGRPVGAVGLGKEDEILLHDQGREGREDPHEEPVEAVDVAEAVSAPDVADEIGVEEDGEPPVLPDDEPLQEWKGNETVEEREQDDPEEMLLELRAGGEPEIDHVDRDGSLRRAELLRRGVCVADKEMDRGPGARLEDEGHEGSGQGRDAHVAGVEGGPEETGVESLRILFRSLFVHPAGPV